MTVQELFIQALALLDETTQERYVSEFQRALIPQVNLVLADMWWLHNRMQRVEDCPSKGQCFEELYDRHKQKYRASRRAPIREVRI